MSIKDENEVLTTYGIIEANDYNSIINKYNRETGFTHYYKNTGDLITSDDWYDLLNSLKNYIGVKYKIDILPNSFNKNGIITSTSWGKAIMQEDGRIYEVTTIGETCFDIPSWATKVYIYWLMAGGAAGGDGDETRGGYSGGGGGSGGYYQNYILNVPSNQKFCVNIGKGGPSDVKWNSTGDSIIIEYNWGGDSFLKVNGNEVLRATGGQISLLKSVGGIGGSPNGNKGSDGVSKGWEKDHLGGNGADSPLGKGGIANWDDKAPSGTGYGAGGAGGCTRDRKKPHYWKGGDGSQGYCKFQFKL